MTVDCCPSEQAVLTVTVDRDPARPGRVTVVVVGELDHGSAELLDGCLDVLSAPTGVSAPGVGELVVDLTGLSFLDAGGLAVLAGAHARAARNGSTLEVVVPDRHAIVLPLRLTGLLGDLDTCVHPRAR